MSEDNREQLQRISDNLREPDHLLLLGQSGISLIFNIHLDRQALLDQRATDPAMLGADLVISQFEEYWQGVDDERLWGLILADLYDLVIDEWSTSQREQGPWKRVFDAHMAIGKSRGWTGGIPVIARMLGKSTAQLANLNAKMNAGGVRVPTQKRRGCYIATAVYGSYDAPPVMVLRQFRDDRLAMSLIGRAFIRSYYFFSPAMAKYFGGATLLNRASRRVLDVIVEKLE